MSVKRWIVLGAIAAAAVVGAVLWRSGGVEVETAAVTLRTVREFVVEEGKTRLATTYTVDMPVPGTLERPELEVGDAVEAGQVIARVDPFEIRKDLQRVTALIEQARAEMAGVDVQKPKPADIEAARARVQQLRQAEAAASTQLEIGRINLEQARREFERRRELLAQGAVSRANFEEYERTYRTQQGEVSRLEEALRGAEAARRAAELERDALIASIDDPEYLREVHGATIAAREAERAQLEDRLAKTEIRAPVSGVVIEKAVESRRVLQPGAPIVVLGRLEDVEIEADILSEDVVRIRTGDPVEVFGEALRGRTVAGTVERIYPAGFEKISALGIEQQRVKVIVAFDNTELKLRPGVRVDVRIVTAERKEVPAVPEHALFRQEGREYVFAVDGGRAVLTPVKVGLRNDEWAEIVEGLEPGDAVVAAPTNELQPDTRVRPAP